MKKSVLCDSFVFIEVYIGTKRSEKIVNFLKGKKIVISSIAVYEIYKKFMKEMPELADFILAETIAVSDKIVAPGKDICARAAELAVKYKNFSMADALMLATAEREQLTLFTGDSDFKENIEEAGIMHLDDLQKSQI